MFSVGEGGLEPPNSSEDRFTVCCNCRYATPPSRWTPQVLLGFIEPMKGLEPPTGWLQISYSTNWVTSAYFQPFKQLFFVKSECKNTTFSKTDKLFFHFLLKKNIKLLISNIIDINIFSFHLSSTPFKSIPSSPFRGTFLPFCNLLYFLFRPKSTKPSD